VVTDNDGATDSTSRNITVNQGGGNILPEFEDFPGYVLTFYGVVGCLLGQTTVTMDTPPNQTIASASVFSFSDNDALDLRASVDLTTGNMAPGAVYRLQGNDMVIVPGAVWSSDPWEYDPQGDSNPNTGSVKVPNLRVDLNADGSPEYSGSISALPQTDRTPH
jgi:hypothetical protein